jgi:hypothetical protein
MATVGDKSRVKINSKLLQEASNETFGITTDTANITTKDSLQWDEIMPVKHNGEMSVDITFSKKPTGTPATLYPVDLVTLQLARTLATFEFAVSDVTGDLKFTGNAYILKSDFKAQTSDKVTYAVTIKPSGTITVGTV